MLKLTKSQSSKTLVFRTTPTKMITYYTIILLDANTWLNVLFVTVTVALTTPKEVKTCQCINKSLLRYHYNCPHYFPMGVHPVTDDTATPPTPPLSYKRKFHWAYIGSVNSIVSDFKICILFSMTLYRAISLLAHHFYLLPCLNKAFIVVIIIIIVNLVLFLGQDTTANQLSFTLLETLLNEDIENRFLMQLLNRYLSN